MGVEEKARNELKELQEEHKQLDAKIEAITKYPPYDQLLVQRMKRRKLTIKDRISFLYEFLCDDIIA
jgi:hypothetical protein